MNNHHARIQRIAAMKPVLTEPPTLQELQAELDRMAENPNYVCRWSDVLLANWTAQLEAELAESRNAE